MSESNQINGILKSASTTGLASIVNMAVGLIRSKVFALFLGTSGVGLTGLYFNIMYVASILGELGSGIAIVRELSADGRSDSARRKIVETGIYMAVVLSVLTGILLYLTRAPIAQHIIRDPARADEMIYLCIGAAAFLGGRILTGALQGMRWIKAYALVVGIGALPGTLAAAIMAARGGMDLIAVISIATPVSVFVTACAVFFFNWRRHQAARAHTVDTDMHSHAHWAGSMLRVGAVLTLSVLLQQVVVLVLRGYIIAQDGLTEAGLFHAAWTISNLYMGLVVAALGTDFYPRLTAHIDRPDEATSILNDGLKVALFLALPLVLGTVGGAMIALNLFFSSEFLGATRLLQYLALGNLAKIVAVTLCYILLARGWRFIYFGLDLINNAIFFGVSYAFYDQYGLEVIGIGFCLGYAVHMILILILARANITFRFQRDTLMIVLFGLISAGVVTGLALWRMDAGIVGSIVMAALATLLSLKIIAAALPEGSRIRRMIARLPGSARLF